MKTFSSKVASLLNFRNFLVRLVCRIALTGCFRVQEKCWVKSSIPNSLLKKSEKQSEIDATLKECRGRQRVVGDLLTEPNCVNIFTLQEACQYLSYNFFLPRNLRIPTQNVTCGR